MALVNGLGNLKFAGNPSIPLKNESRLQLKWLPARQAGRSAEAKGLKNLEV